MVPSREFPRRYVGKLVKNGNSVQVTIPQRALWHLGWIPAQLIISEITDENTLHVRPMRETDLAPRGRMGFIPVEPNAAKK